MHGMLLPLEHGLPAVERIESGDPRLGTPARRHPRGLVWAQWSMALHVCNLLATQGQPFPVRWDAPGPGWAASVRALRPIGCVVVSAYGAVRQWTSDS